MTGVQTCALPIYVRLYESLDLFRASQFGLPILCHCFRCTANLHAPQAEDPFCATWIDFPRYWSQCPAIPRSPQHHPARRIVSHDIGWRTSRDAGFRVFLHLAVAGSCSCRLATIPAGAPASTTVRYAGRIGTAIGPDWKLATGNVRATFPSPWGTHNPIWAGKCGNDANFPLPAAAFF